MTSWPSAEVMRTRRVVLGPDAGPGAPRWPRTPVPPGPRATTTFAAKIAAHQAWAQQVAWSTYTDHAHLPPAGAYPRGAIGRGDQAPLVTQR